MQDASGWMQGIANQMQSPWQQQMQGGAYQGVNAQDVLGAIQGGMAPQQSNTQFINESIMGGAGNDYVDAMKSQMQSDSYENLMKTMSGLDARAAATGMGGGSRHGIAQGQAIQGSQDALADAQTNLGYQTFDRDLDRKLGIAGQADQANLARYQTGTGNLMNMLAGQQGAMGGGLGFGGQMQQAGLGQFSPYMVPWQMAGQWGNTMGGPTVLSSGNMSGSSSGKSKSGGVGK
jgi:hypothetical protein